jgi:DNA-directed RNA polymerase subunit omega
VARLFFKLLISSENNVSQPVSFRLNGVPFMRDDYLRAALTVINDPNILVNVISTRVKQLKRGSRALVVSLEKLSLEDTALREVAEGKISYALGPAGPTHG